MRDLATQVLALARDSGVMIATAESCTGGMIVAELTEISGSSDVVDCGFVTYSNAAKVKMLGVSPDTLSQHGAVSPETAAEMALGALKHSGADIAISVTGVAGPSGGTADKPVGRVCFGLATHKGVAVQTMDFGPLGRAGVRAATVSYALEWLALELGSIPQQSS